MDRLGIDIDTGVAQFVDTVYLMNLIRMEFTAFITTSNMESSHFHIEAEHPTCLILRRFFNDDPVRIFLALKRPYNNNTPQDLLFEWKGDRKRIKLENHILELIMHAKEEIGLSEEERIL